MRTDIPASVASDLLNGWVYRYCRIDFTDGTYLYASDHHYNVSSSYIGDFGGSPFGYFPFASSEEEAQIASAIVSSWGTRTICGDHTFSAKSTVFPMVERSFSLVNTSETGWIGKRVIDGTLVNSTITFFVVSKTSGEVWTEDILTIIDPISFSPGQCDIGLTACSTLVKYINRYTGNYNAAAGLYDNIIVGSIDNRTGAHDAASGPYTTLSATLLSTGTTVSVPSGAADAFPASGTLYIDGVSHAYSSRTSSSFTLSAQSGRQHDSGSYVFLFGATYYYAYGVGPVTSGAAKLTTGDGDYENSHSIILNNNPLKCSFPDSFPYKVLHSTTVQTKNDTLGVADLIADTYGRVSSGPNIYGTASFTGTRQIAHTGNLNLQTSLAIPAGAEIESITCRVRMTLQKYSQSQTQTSSISSGFDESSLNPSPTNPTERYNNYYFRLKGDSQATDWSFSCFHSIVPPAPPSGWTVTGGYIYFLAGLYRNDVTGKITYKAGNNSEVEFTTSEGYRELDYNVTVRNFTGSSWYSATTYIYLDYKPLGGNTTGDTFANFRDLYIYASIQKISTSSVYATVTSKIFGINRTWSASSGTVNIDNTYYASTITELENAQNSFLVNMVSGIADSTERLVVTITEIKYTAQYTTEAAGYPKYSIYSPETTTLIFTSANNDVTPPDAVRSLILSCGSNIEFDSSYQTTNTWYSTRSFLCNGYFNGQDKFLDSMRSIALQSRMNIYEEAGKLFVYPRLIKELYPYDSIVDITSDDIISGTLNFEVQTISDIVNTLDCSYNADVNLVYSSSYSYSYIVGNNVQSNGEPLTLSLIDSQVFAENTVQYYVQRNCTTGMFVSFEATPKAAVLNFGDPVNIDLDGFCEIDYVRGEIVSVSANYSGTGGGLTYTVTAFCGGSAISAGGVNEVSETVAVSTATESFPGHEADESVIISTGTTEGPNTWDTAASTVLLPTGPITIYAGDTFGLSDFGTVEFAASSTSEA